MGKPTGFMEYDRCEAASVDFLLKGTHGTR